MQVVPRRDTQPELAVRRAIWKQGLRYRVDVRPLPALRRRADIVFLKPKVAVFVDGCFWHSCPHCCRGIPRSNRAWWSEKLARNVDRDRDTDRRLIGAGWTVIRLWEHADPADAAAMIADLVRE